MFGYYFAYRIGSAMGNAIVTVLAILGAAIAAIVLGIAIFIAANWAPEKSVEELKARWAPPPSTFLEVDGLSVHLRDEGPRDDQTPIVLLHGSGTSLHAWEGWVAALKDKRRVIKSIKDRIAHGHNVSIAEVGALDEHRRAILGIAMVANDRGYVEGGLSNVVQIGIHGFANAESHARWALEHKVHVVSADRVRGGSIGKAVAGGLRFLGNATRIWVDFDMDVLDRAYAPGAPAAMPGGLLPHELEEAAFLLGREKRVAGIDITEVDPERDVAEMTVRAACAVLLSFCTGVASR